MKLDDLVSFVATTRKIPKFQCRLNRSPPKKTLINFQQICSLICHCMEKPVKFG